MTISCHGLKIFFPRSLLHIRPCVRTYFSTKYTSCPLKTCINQKCYLRIFSRSFSKESFFNYQTTLFNRVSESDICVFTKDFFVCMHDLSGLPWWCTIIASAAILKLYAVPCTVYQLKLINRLSMVNNEMANIIQQAGLEMRAKQHQFMWTPAKTKTMHKLKVMSERKQLIEKNNCHPLKIVLLGFFEIPVWIIISMTWRAMAYGFSHDIPSSKALISQMATEGPFWCVNLTIPDPTYILSLLIFLTHFAVLDLSHVQEKLLKSDVGTIRKVIRILFRAFGIIACVISSFAPSSVAVFWLSSIMLTLLRDLCLISPKVRRALRLPYRNFSYQEVFESWKNKYLKKVK